MNLQKRMGDFKFHYVIKKPAASKKPVPSNNRQWIREVLKLEPAGALACSGFKSRKAFEFPTDKALKDYLHQHPDADRKHHWVKQQKPHTPAPTTQHAPAVEKKFGAHKVFDAQHPLGKEEDHFRAIIGNPDPHNPWQVKDKDAIRSYLTKKLGQKPKYDDVKREVQQRQKAAEVISYGFWSATKHTADPTFKLDMVTNRRGIPQGMVTSYETPENELEIGALASSGQVRGMGTYLIAKTIKQQLKEGERLTLSALDTAKPFYRKIGMKAVDPIGPMFYFEYNDAMKFADKVYGELGARKTASVADLKDLAIVQLQDGNWNYDEYMRGMANGMILSLHTVHDFPGSPNFLTRPEKYLADEVLKVAKDLLAFEFPTQDTKCHVIYPPEPFDFKQPPEPPVVFLAGSIDMGKSEDWQAKVINWLADVPCVVLNPRRKDWDSSWKQEFENPQFREQVEWELKGLEQASLVAMCFTEKSQAPISLLELGLHVIGRRMIVFCPNGYWRKGNVDVVCNRYGVPVYEDFDEFLRMVKSRILEISVGTHEPAVLPEGTVQNKTKYFLTASDRIAKRLLTRDFVVASLRVRLAVSELPNDVMENGYPQEYMSPSPAEVGSVRPGDDKLLTGRTAAKEKKHYRFDPGHRRKPGPGWSETESGWTKPRPTQLQQSVKPAYEPSGVQPQHSFVGRGRRYRGSF